MEGYVGLFLSALLAATVLPFSSEAVVVGLMALLALRRIPVLDDKEI